MAPFVPAKSIHDEKRYHLKTNSKFSLLVVRATYFFVVNLSNWGLVKYMCVSELNHTYNMAINWQNKV